MDFLVEVVTTIGECAFAPIARQFGYIYNYKRNVDNLKIQIQNLKSEREKMQHCIDEATRNDENIEVAVEEWMSRVTDIIGKAEEKFFKEEDYAKPMCSSKFFPNLVSRMRLGETVSSSAEAATAEIHRASSLSQKVGYRVPPQSVAIDTNGGDFMTFPSRISIFNETMEALRNPHTRMIGVYGIGGVGKTMLANEVARKAVEVDKLFKKAVIVTLSQNPDPKKIQKGVADQLGIKLDVTKEWSVCAQRLRHQLGREEKMLLVLDDIWEKFDLNRFGITFGRDKNDCKILIISRSRDVVCNDMNADASFCIGDLPFGEAKALFEKRVGGQSMENPDIQALASEIVKECGGLPIAIATVASALKNKSYPIWSNALQELRRSSPTNIRGMEKKVYSSIKMSYDFLESEEAKLLLLFSSLLSEDVEIEMEELFKYVVGLEPFQTIPTLEEARNKLVALVDNLKAASLVLNVDSQNIFKLHDVIRDVVIHVGSEEYHMYNIMNVHELQYNRKLKGATAVSLHDIPFSYDELPERLDCPKLVFFCMPSAFKHSHFWMTNRYIQHPFFLEMKELRVLNLAYFYLKPLPSSLRFVQNLQTLRLKGCKVGDVALIGELRNLRILDFSYSEILKLPKEIGRLTRLQLLDLNYCSQFKEIEQNVISSLIHLEELYMLGSFTQWDADGGKKERRNASLVELKSLPRLTTLLLELPCVNSMPKDLFSVNLKRYNISIGENPGNKVWAIPEIFWNPNAPPSRILELGCNISRFQELEGLEMLVKNSEVLSLFGSIGVKDVIHELDRMGLPKLQHLSIMGDNEMQYIINSMEQKNHPPSVFFGSLETLQLLRLKNLEKICHGKLSANSFGNLRVVTVKDCDRLKSLFSFSMVKLLEKIEVENCKMVSEIVTYGIENEAIAKIEFARLRSLKLRLSPKLVHFVFSESETRKKELLDVNHPIPLFSTMVALPSLEELMLSSLNCENLWPEHPSNTLNMQDPRSLVVRRCNSLKYLSSFAMAKRIVKLERLVVSKCGAMEDLVAINDGQGKEKLDKQSFPNLKLLGLQDLTNLEKFCSKILVLFSSLVSLAISNCPKLEGLVLSKQTATGKSSMDDGQKKSYHPAFAGRAFQNLKFLYVHRCHLLKNLVPLWISFQSLTLLQVSKCHRMESLLASSTATSLTQLRVLDIHQCKSMAQIVKDHDGCRTQGEIVFQRLEVLILDDLHNLMSFYSGDCVMKFPKLRRLFVGYCPQMLSFCKEDISAPKLKELILTIQQESKGEDEDEGKDDTHIGYQFLEYFTNDDQISKFINDFDSYKGLAKQLTEGDINAAIRKLWLTNQG